MTLDDPGKNTNALSRALDGESCVARLLRRNHYTPSLRLALTAQLTAIAHHYFRQDHLDTFKSIDEFDWN